MPTIARNHTRKLAAIKKRAKVCYVLSLRNNFVRDEVQPAYAWEELARYHQARLTDDGDHWTIHIHSNLWYELRETKREA